MCSSDLWRSGVDILCFGATKNGALAAEAVIIFKPELAGEAAYRHKRVGQLFSKMRFISAQLEAYIAGGLWLENARHANAQATRLAEGIEATAGVELLYPVQGNELFATLSEPVLSGLLEDGFMFHRWRDGGQKETPPQAGLCGHMNPALDFLAEPVFRHFEVIGRLEVHPEFRTGGEIAAEPKRGVGADAAFGV